MKRAASASLVVASVLCACALSAFAQEHQHDHDNPTGPLGTVHFPTSCNRAVAQDFDHGIALLHSFWYISLRRSLETLEWQEHGSISETTFNVTGFQCLEWSLWSAGTNDCHGGVIDCG